MSDMKTEIRNEIIIKQLRFCCSIQKWKNTVIKKKIGQALELIGFKITGSRK